MNQNIMSFHGNFSHQLAGKGQRYPLGLSCPVKVGIIETAPHAQPFAAGIVSYARNDD